MLKTFGQYKLILVVVDDGLVLKYGLNAILMQLGVLILVVVDNGLVHSVISAVVSL